MATVFINTISGVFAQREGRNASTVQCTSDIDHYLFYQFTLIPAVLITFSFMITKQRRRILLHVLTGRPGLIFPMDTLSRSSRISYACSFGATALLVYNIVLSQQLAIDYTGDIRAVRSFMVIVSMFIYGLAFFPLFASLAVGSVFGYFLGILYAWMMFAVQIYKLCECPDLPRESRIALIMRNLPTVVCLGYLSFFMPVRMLMAWRKGRYFKWTDDFEETNSIVDIRTSYSGHHVMKLFRKPKVKQPPETKKDRVTGCLRSLVSRFLYQRKKGFRYPGRLISVLFNAMIVVYVLSFESMLQVQVLLSSVVDATDVVIQAAYDKQEVEGESEELTSSIGVLNAFRWVFNTGRICLIVSNVLAAVGAVLNVLHTLSSYRANIYALYRGDHSHIPPASFSSNVNHCVNSIKYAGYQVGYIIWGFLLHFFIIFLLALLLAILIQLLVNGFTGWLIWLIQFMW